MRKTKRAHDVLMDGLLLAPVWLLLLTSIILFAAACLVGLLPHTLYRGFTRPIRYGRRLVAAYASYILGFAKYLEGEVRA